MFRRFSANFAVFSIFVDLVFSAGALHLSALLRPYLSRLPGVEAITAYVALPWLLYLLFPALWAGVLLLFSVYDGRKNFKVVDEFTSLTFGSALAGISMAGVLYLSYRDVSRFLFLFFVLTGYLLMLLWRVGARLAFRYRWMRGQKSRRVLVLGAGSMGEDFARKLHMQPMFNLKLVGFLDDDIQKQLLRPDVLGSLDDVRQVLSDHQVDDVVVALPRSANGRLNRVVGEMHNLPVRVWVMLDYYSLTLHRAQMEEFAGIPMLDLRAPALSEYQRIIKRAFDLTVCGLLLPFALPLVGVAALLIWLDDRGPIFYHAARMGENGKIFRMHKFRTMVVNAEQRQAQVDHLDEHGRVIHKSAHDPRITRMGRFLRRTSLDELPQFFNVLKGEMSLVGPRPEMPYLVDQYAPWQRKRFAVPQGLTGWWQVNGRSDKPMHLHTEEDLYYIQHYSLWLDMQILFKTAWTVLRGKGAF